MLFDGLHRASWYHCSLEVSRNALLENKCALGLVRVGPGVCVLLFDFWLSGLRLVGSQALPAFSQMPRNARLQISGILAVLLFTVFCSELTTSLAGEVPLQLTPGPSARVLSVSDANATDAFKARPEIVRGMVDRAITRFTHQPSVAAAWLSLVSTQDVIGIKVYSMPGPNVGTRTAVVAGVVEGLLRAGVPPKHIVIWDKQPTELRQADYYDLGERLGVRVEASTQAGYDLTNFYDSPII
jgi:hypothetical protein